MDLVLIVAFIFTLGKTLSQRTADNGRNAGIRCFEQLIQEGDISNLLIDVTTPDRINVFCRRHGALQKCTRENEHYLTVKENTEYLRKTSGVHNFYVNICPPGTDLTSDYKGNSPCFKLIKNEILSCGSDLPDMNSYKMKNDLTARCCSLKNHRECLKRVTSENCGNEAAEVIEKVLIRYFDRIVKQCNSTSINCRENESTISDDWTTAQKWKSSTTRLYFPTYKDHKHHSEEDWKSTTHIDKNVDWKHTTEEDAWKKHKHNNAFTITLNSAVSLFSCFVMILFHKL